MYGDGITDDGPDRITGGIWAPMSGFKQRRKQVLARHSVLSGRELTAILDHFEVSKLLFARHTGYNEVTVRRFCSGEQDGKIPLVIEWVLMTYYYAPWTRRARNRIALPFREWGVPRDDTEGMDEHDALDAALTIRKGYYVSPLHRQISRLRRAVEEMADNPDPDARRQIADEVLSPNKPDGDSEHYSATPAEPFGPPVDCEEE